MEHDFLSALGTGLAELRTRLYENQISLNEAQRLGWAPTIVSAAPVTQKDRVFQVIIETLRGISEQHLSEIFSSIIPNCPVMLQQCLLALRDEGYIVSRRGHWFPFNRAKSRRWLVKTLRGEKALPINNISAKLDTRMNQLDHAIISVKIAAARKQIEEIEQLMKDAREHRGTIHAPGSNAPLPKRIRALLRQSPTGLTTVEFVQIIQPTSDRPKDAIWQCLSRLKKAGELYYTEGRWSITPSTNTKRRRDEFVSRETH